MAENSAATTTGSPPFLAPSSMGTWLSLLLETSFLLCGPSPETKTMAIQRNASQVMVTSYKMLPSLPIGSLLYQYQGAGMESFICGISTPVPQTADSLDTLKTLCEQSSDRFHVEGSIHQALEHSRRVQLYYPRWRCTHRLGIICYLSPITANPIMVYGSWDKYVVWNLNNLKSPANYNNNRS